MDDFFLILWNKLLRKNFVIRKENHCFAICRFTPTRNDSGITLDYTNYSENVKPIAFNYDNESNSKDLLQSQTRKLLRITGRLRPDIAFDVCQLGTRFKYSDDKDIKYAKKSLHI